jgi:Type II restriction endonuclease EcoO109I
VELNSSELTNFVSNNLEDFHKKRLQGLKVLKLNKVLARKNPYLFRAKGIATSEVFVKTILDAFLSSQEEGVFGGFLESLAIFVCHKAYGGQKSSAEGIDLEFNIEATKYIVSIKSGPNWGNSQQIKRMKDNFLKAKRILGTNTTGVRVVAVNGCCYGKDEKYDKGDYLKLCGQRFWELISGNPELYIEIVEPLGYKAKERNEDFLESYATVINNFSLEFMNNYCDDGKINWAKIISLTSDKGNNI